MILADYSGISIAAITQLKDELSGDDSYVENVIRHAILASLKTYNRQFRREYGDMVICCDDKNYWRKKIFPYYKYKRSINKEKSDFPWEKINKYMDMVKEELKEHFPYKVIQVKGAEADDIIGILTTEVAAKNIVQNGLYEEPEKVMIVSADKDMKQLTNEYVKQWLHRDRKFAVLDEPAKRFLRRLILTGDSGDGVPNVFSPLDSFYTGTRQKPATEKKLQPFLDAKNMIDATDDESIKQRIAENARLISFAFIPKEVKEAIISEYSIVPNGNKMKVFKYMSNHNMKSMIEDIDDF